jgi:hypothetical protein
MDQNNRSLGAANAGAIIAIVAIIAGGIAFTMLRDRPSTSPSNQTNTNQNTQNNNTNTMMSRVEVPLTAQYNSGQNGKAILTEENGKTKVVIEVVPGPTGVGQPAHLHAGDCTALGAIKYELNDVVDGRSETILTPSMHFIHGLGQTAINFHKSRAEYSIYGGCGNLKQAFDQAMHTGN